MPSNVQGLLKTTKQAAQNQAAAQAAAKATAARIAATRPTPPSVPVPSTQGESSDHQ